MIENKWETGLVPNTYVYSFGLNGKHQIILRNVFADMPDVDSSSWNIKLFLDKDVEYGCQLEKVVKANSLAAAQERAYFETLDFIQGHINLWTDRLANLQKGEENHN